MRRSFSSMSTSMSSPMSGIIESDAKQVWRRFCESNGEMRTSRWMPISLRSRP